MPFETVLFIYLFLSDICVTKKYHHYMDRWKSLIHPNKNKSCDIILTPRSKPGWLAFRLMKTYIFHSIELIILLINNFSFSVSNYNVLKFTVEYKASYTIHPCKSISLLCNVWYMCNKLERLIYVVGEYNDILKYSIFVLNIDEFKKKISHIENHIENIVIEKKIVV